MKVLVDTNVLLRIAQPHSPQMNVAIDALDVLYVAEYELCLVPQVIYEYWVSATRPLDRNGLGLTLAQVQAAVDFLHQDYVLLHDDPGIYTHWFDLVTKHQVLGKQAHDARLVAAMQRHAITALLTFNDQDFTRFSPIQVFTPADILAGKLPA